MLLDSLAELLEALVEELAERELDDVGRDELETGVGDGVPLQT